MGMSGTRPGMLIVLTSSCGCTRNHVAGTSTVKQIRVPERAHGTQLPTVGARGNGHVSWMLVMPCHACKYWPSKSRRGPRVQNLLLGCCWLMHGAAWKLSWCDAVGSACLMCHAAVPREAVRAADAAQHRHGERGHEPHAAEGVHAAEEPFLHPQQPHIRLQAELGAGESVLGAGSRLAGQGDRQAPKLPGQLRRSVIRGLGTVGLLARHGAVCPHSPDVVLAAPGPLPLPCSLA